MASATIHNRVYDRQTRMAAFPGGSRLFGRRHGGTHPGSQPVPVPGLARNIEVKIASTFAEWEEAFALVAGNYQSCGYEADDRGAYRFTPYHALPDTVVMVAKHRGHVVATFSLVPDNTLLGLPLEGIYRSEVQELRHSGRRIFETTSLADRDLSTREFVQVFLALIQLAWQYGIRQGAETTVITVNPRHRDFYTKVLGYVPLGPRRAYPTVQGAPAEAFFLDPELLRLKAPQVHQRLFGRRLPAAALTGQPIPADAVRHFGSRSCRTDPRIVEEILRYVEECGSPRRW